MLGSLIVGAAAVRQQQIEVVTAANQLGPMVVKASDRARAIAAAGLAEPAPAAAPPAAPVADEGFTVREIQAQLRDNPATVRAIVQAEGEREKQGLQMRVSVLRLCLASAKAQELTPLVEAIESAIASSTTE